MNATLFFVLLLFFSMLFSDAVGRISAFVDSCPGDTGVA